MSNTFARLLGIVVALSSAGLLAMAGDEKTTASITKQADDVSKKDWKALAKQGEAMAKAHDLADVMNLFKLRKEDEPKKSGLGVGAKPGAIKPDGIEAKIMNIMRNPMAPNTLKKEQAELIRLAEITASIASVSVHQSTVEKKMGEKDPAKWKQWSEEMHNTSVDLIKAVKSSKPEAVRDAAKKVYATCTECHAVFRDQ